MKYKVSKKFIKEAHSSACSDWKEKIEAEFPKLFPKSKFELNKWYKPANEEDSIWFIKSINADGSGVGYGVCLGRWDSESKGICIHKSDFGWRPATEQEVQAALKKEAKKIGFKKGATFKNLDGGIQTVSEIGHYFSLRDNGLCCGSTPRNEWYLPNCQSNTYLFKEGVWATIIEEPQIKQMTVAEVSKLAGCKVEIIE